MTRSIFGQPLPAVMICCRMRLRRILFSSRSRTWGWVLLEQRITWLPCGSDWLFRTSGFVRADCGHERLWYAHTF